MSSKTGETKKSFLSGYKKYLIAFVLLYVILTLALILLSRSDTLPFLYQVF